MAWGRDALSYALASFIERIIEALKRRGDEIINNSRISLGRVLVLIARFHSAISKEEKVTNLIKIISLNVLRLQSSLEDSLSALSLLLEFLSSLSIVLILVILWLSY